MPTATDNAYVAADVPPTAVPSDGSNLKSIARDLAGSDKPCRLEGEVSDLVVLGKSPFQPFGNLLPHHVRPLRSSPSQQRPSPHRRRWKSLCISLPRR